MKFPQCDSCPEFATEDERFYDHSGIDAEAGRVVFTLGTQGGGSTITQQVAKMMLGQEGEMYW